MSKDLIIKICRVVHVGAGLTLSGIALKKIIECDNLERKLHKAELNSGMYELKDIINKIKIKELNEELEELKAKRK